MTGASGYVGELLANALATQGHTVHALCRDVAKAKKMLQNPNIKVFEGDLLDISKIEIAMKDCEQVYHLAAYAKVWDKDNNAFYQMNVVGTENILNIAHKLGVKKMVFTSTAGVLGPCVGEIVTEKTPQTVPHSTEYERTKAQAEQKVADFISKNAGFEVVTVCPTRVYGAGQMSQSNAVTLLIEKYYHKKWKILPDDGTKMGNYVFVGDVVKGHILAMQYGKSGEKYLLGGENATYRQFFDMIGQVCGHHLKLIKMPYHLMLFFAKIQQFLADNFGRPPLITPAFVRKYLYNWHSSSAKAEKELGYKITPLREGIKNTVDWLKSKE